MKQLARNINIDHRVKNDADDDDHDRVRIAVARATLNDFAWDVMIIMKTD